MANFCENCGSPLKSENRFCPNCGAPVKSVEASDPVAPVPPNPSPAAQPTPENSPSSTLSSAAAADSASSTGAAVGAAAAATAGAFHPETAPEKPQEAFIPPQQNPYPDQQPLHEEAITDNRPASSSLRQEAERAFPHSGYSRPEEFARGGTGPKYEPDEDFRSMFLRFDNRLNRKRYIKRSLALIGIGVILIIIMGIIAALINVNPKVLGLLISVVLLIPSYSLMIRRLHDLNRPGWWCIPSIIQVVLHLFENIPNPAVMSSTPSFIGGVLSLVNFAIAIYLLFFKGTDGFNQYGPDPLETQN